mmetsp:Transcript_2957/g.10705  ORF Transcript_2957/g.10705 Transcript_2957/m.10705 type:complete len:261 (-) Transcript_2957:839-1621(-)
MFVSKMHVSRPGPCAHRYTNNASAKRGSRRAYVPNRREFGGYVATSLLYLLQSEDSVAFEDGKQVSAYLPASDELEGYFRFDSGLTRTPALRAGAIGAYSICLPGQWKEVPVSNAKSGNYCQPRCDEATTEVQFASALSGSVQIIIIPTNKLMISEKFPTIEAVGTLEAVLNAVSPAITGSVAVEQEEILSKQSRNVAGSSYYEYELLTPFAAYGIHNLASVTTTQNYVMIATAAASEKQWESSQQELRTIISSFTVSKM